MRLSIFPYLIAVFLVSSCSDSNDTPDESNQIPVWKSDSVKSELYLPTFSELDNSLSPLPTPIATINVDTATPEQLSDLISFRVEKPFENSPFCDIAGDFDLFYLVITDQDGNIRTFLQDGGCSFSRRDDFFQIEPEGFISDQQICDFGLSFGIEGYLCTER